MKGFKEAKASLKIVIFFLLLISIIIIPVVVNNIKIQNQRIVFKDFVDYLITFLNR